MQVPWRPNHTEFQELFSNDLILKILVTLAQQENMRSSASELASILNIHKSTAKKYLALLYKHNFVTKKDYSTLQGKPSYYRLLAKQITIILDVDTLFKNLQDEFFFPDIKIREKSNIYPRIMYVFDEEGRVKAIKVKKRTKARKTITLTIKMNHMEGKLIKILPHPTMDPESFISICTKLNIEDNFTKKSLYLFILKLKKYGIIDEFS
ncbi:MAG: MarR family transcriptional regulator [Candidatus Hodarchaeota archaeon]